MKIMIDLPEDLRKSIFDDGVFHISNGYRLAGCVMQGKIVEESEEDDDAIEPDEFTEALDKFNDAIDASRNAKVIKQLSAHVKCLECQVSGNLCKGDECPTQYEAGTMGEIIANIKTAIMALKQEPCEDAISWQESILDKIETEIERLNPVDYVSMSSYEGHKGARDMKDDILRIIDKYNAGNKG